MAGNFDIYGHKTGVFRKKSRFHSPAHTGTVTYASLCLSHCAGPVGKQQAPQVQQQPMMGPDASSTTISTGLGGLGSADATAPPAPRPQPLPVPNMVLLTALLLNIPLALHVLPLPFISCMGVP